MRDPVCGMEVDPKTAAGSSVHQGLTYYFCSKECKAVFDKDPKRYVGPEVRSGHGTHEHGSRGHV